MAVDAENTRARDISHEKAAVNFNKFIDKYVVEQYFSLKIVKIKYFLSEIFSLCKSIL